MSGLLFVVAALGQAAAALVITADNAAVTPAPRLELAKRTDTTLGYRSTGTSGGTTQWGMVTMSVAANQYVSTSGSLYRLCTSGTACNFFSCNGAYVQMGATSSYCGTSSGLTCSSDVLFTGISDTKPLTNYWCDQSTLVGWSIYATTPTAKAASTTPAGSTPPAGSTTPVGSSAAKSAAESSASSAARSAAGSSVSSGANSAAGSAATGAASSATAPVAKIASTSGLGSGVDSSPSATQGSAGLQSTILATTSDEKKTPVGPIVGGVIGGIAVIAAIVVAAILLLRKKKQAASQPPAHGQATYYQPEQAPSNGAYGATTYPEKGPTATTYASYGTPNAPMSPAPQYTPNNGVGMPAQQFQQPMPVYNEMPAHRT